MLIGVNSAEETKSIMDVNHVLHQLGNFGLFQFYIYALSLVPALVAGVAALSNVFLLGVPHHRCFVDGCDNSNSDYLEAWFNLTLPKSPALNGKGQNCLHYNGSDSDTCFGNISNETKSCDTYIYASNEFDRTAASEFNLVCEDSWMISFSEAFYMTGNLFGALVYGFCADRFGRRSVFLWGPIVGCVAALGAAFSPNIVFFTVISFLIPFTSNGLYMTSFVLAIEFIGTKWRVWCANIYQMVFALGEIMLATIAYFVRDWRHLQIVISAIMSIMIILPWLFPESVRWQVSKGNTTGAWKTVRKAARWNNVVLTEDDEMSPDKEQVTLPQIKDDKVSPLTIITHPLLRRWSINLYFNWAVNALVYYGLSLSASKMGDAFSIYVTFILLSAVELPFNALIAVAMQWKFLGRRRSLSGSMIAAGIACLIPSFLPESALWMSVYLGVIGKGFIAASFSLVYFYTAEIYPTVLRSNGVGICSTFSRFGAILAPFVAELKSLGPSGPLIICGVFSLTAGILALDLPETLGKELPDTVEDVYKLKKNTDEMLLNPRNSFTSTTSDTRRR